MSRLFKVTAPDQVWLYTDGDVAVTHLSDTYTPAYIKADETVLSSDIEKSVLDIKVAITNTMAQYLLVNFVEANVTVTVFKSLAGGVKQVWKGNLFSVQPNGKDISLAFETLKSSLQKRGPRFKFQRRCPYTIYAIGCNKEKDDVASSLRITNLATDGITMTVEGASAFGDGYFDLGMVELPDSTFRTIVSHVGDTLRLSYPSPSLLALQPVGWGHNWGYTWGGNPVLRFFPGCDGSRTVCDERFDNINNYGGCPQIPLKNPTGKEF